MTYQTVEYIENELADRWSEDISQREQTVPQPRIIPVSSEDQTRVSNQHDDLLFVKEGGFTDVTPKSLGWREEELENRLTLDIRTTHGRARLEGTRTSTNDRDPYGGLRGETKRIIDEIRKGHKEFNLISGYEWNPLSEDIGYAYWRGAWEVRLTEYAHTINP